MSNIIKEGAFSGWDTDANGKRWEDYDTIVCPDGQIVDMQKLLEDQARASAALVHLCPAYGGFVNKLRRVYTFRVSTQATDGYNLLVNPQFTANLDFTGKVFVLAHEIMHCVLNHMRRGKGHDPEKSNIAADYECNITLVDLELFQFDTIKKLGAYIDKKYSGWGYEKIYADQPKGNPSGNMNNSKQSQQAQQNQQGQQAQQNQQGQQNSNGSGGSGGSNGSGDNQPKSADYKKGWKKAIEDYKKGKLKL